MIRPLLRQGKIFEAAPVAPPDVSLRDIMAAGEDPLPDPLEIDFDVFRSDVDQDDLEAQTSCSNHHVKIVPAGKRGFDGEALALLEAHLGRMQNFSAGRDW